jgi:hypothetical protein
MNKILSYLCFIAILPLPYSYYMLLRPIVCLGLIFLLVKDWNNITSENKAICIVIAVLFNPFSAIYLSKLVWIPIDLLSGFYLLKKYELKTN